jgi:hypothetical protein
MYIQTALYIPAMLGYLHGYLVMGKTYGYFTASYLGIVTKVCGYCGMVT